MHRRASSLAVIDRPPPQEKDRLASIHESSPTPTTSPAAMAYVRRRMRPLAIVFAALVLLLLVIFSGVFTSTSSSTSRVDYSSAVSNELPLAKHAARPYPPALAPDRIPPHGSDDAIHADTGSYGGKKDKPIVSSNNNNIAPLKLTLAEELGAVVAYLLSLGANARIPNTIDPSRTIDAELILGFNTRSPRANAEVAELVRETWEINPVIMFGEAQQPTTKALKTLLENMNIAPKPRMIFIDEREDTSLLEPLIYRLTGATSFPVLLIGGQAQGSLNDVLAMRETGELTSRLNAAGAEIVAKKGKKGRR